MQKYDIVLWGATSFAGQIVAKYIAKQYGYNQNIKWAIAGRNQKKLTQLKESLPGDKSQLPIELADSNDYSSLEDLVKKTKVIISTVGPFMLYGENLVKACAVNGTDYCDLTGEVPFVKSMQDKYEEDVKKSGARIIHCCGVDSIPSDLGIFYLNQKSLEKFNSPIKSALTAIKKFKGAFSGGTVSSIINMIDARKENPELIKQSSKPYSLCFDQNTNKPRQPDLNTYCYNNNIKKWLTPFLMSTVNSKIVHASNSRLAYPYGKAFEYSEFMIAPKKSSAVKVYYGMGLMMLTLGFKPTRWILEKFFLPKPGEGPSIEQQEQGFFVYNIYGKTYNNDAIVVEVTGDKDPGYGSSAQMLAESAICMALDIDKNKLSGGFWTPASAMGNSLIERLVKYAGLTFNVII